MKFAGLGEGVGCRTSGERRLALNVTCHSRLARAAPDWHVTSLSF
jgi:hypothetical protein